MQGTSNLTSTFIRAPLLRVSVPFILGLVSGRFLPVPMTLGWALVLCSFFLWIYLAWRTQVYGRRWQAGAVLFILLFAFGNLWQGVRSDLRRADHVGQLAEQASGWEVQVTEVISANGRTVRAWTDVRAALIDGQARPATGRMMVTLLHDSTRRAIRTTDRLLLASKAVPIDKTPNPGGFDVRQWAGTRAVYHESFAPLERWKLVSEPAPSGDIFERAQKQIATWLVGSGLPDRERGLVKAILLGLRDELDREQNQDFVRSGTIHVLAVSGAHVGIIYVAVLWGLVLLGKNRPGRIIRGVVALAALWAYAGLTGFTPSVLRATVMFSLFTIAEMGRARTEPLNSLACAAVLLLLWDPQMMVHLGFQLSFLAVLGIALFYRPMLLRWAPPGWAGRSLWSLAVVSLSAQAFTTPLCLYVFQAFPVWFLPANMVIVGLVGLGVYGGTVLLVVHAIPVLGPIITLLMKWLLLLLGFLSAFFAGLPGAYPAVRIGPWGMAGMYVLLVFFSFWVMRKSKWARLGTYATLAVLLFAWGWTAHQRNAQEGFTLYADRDGVACAFLQGRTLHVFGPADNPWAVRNVEEHARAVGAMHVVWQDSMPRWVAQGSSAFAFLPVARAEESTDWPDPPHRVVLYGKGWLDTRQLPEAGPAEWVLNADMEWKPRAVMRDWAEENGAALHDMRLAGAYVR